ncbi:phage head-tail adapter protein [Bifidobacterium panos]|uniref:Phage head-tail adapter protein n=1 Tax=Bifidobacterium panos TaxID=2675321 RepID=A0ABX1SUJ5_9BIFI|nr:phage head-tail adapter protein [Bifidobacterium sp. DSM 109963]NMN01488.1 phage head-tail adapter protein [Bifidobacterium sp. DSM 109963]
MNKEWSDLNKTLQMQLRKESTFSEGIKTLLTLRQALMDELLNMKHELRREDFNAMPFPNAKGYHSKTIAYSIWHVFRIEDIVAHSLIQNDSEIFNAYQSKIGAPIITTGNELAGSQIEDFSKAIDLDALYAYAVAVKDSTDRLLKQLSYRDLHRKFGEADKERLQRLQVVSTDESACWLIEYWCGKDVRGLLRMPFSRHWIMHIEASIRIKNKIHPRSNCVPKLGRLK